MVALFSLALLVLDTQFHRLDTVRSGLATGLAPVIWLGHAPDKVRQWGSELFTSRDDLLQENESLRARLLILERRALRYAALAADNSRLRELLNASEELDDRVVVAEIIGVSPDPFSHEVIINKGSRDNVVPGQAILDAHGLMGQVVHTSGFTSRVLLISDSSHAVPVEVLRNGIRAILLGNGDLRRLDVVHVPDTADIREGDVLISSGLGGRFPKGYPVAEVSRVEKDPGEPFARIIATPMAQLNKSRLVLVLFQQEESGLAAEPGQEAQP